MSYIKLYKFRPLSDCESLCRVKHTLRTGEFWCSRFWDLNDPMEGVYSFTQTDNVNLAGLFQGKARRSVCSFSGSKALRDPTMWGYYADGFKGVAIEVQVSKRDDEFRAVDYVECIPSWSKAMTEDETVTRFLTTKLERWKHEVEYRHLSQLRSGWNRLATITGIYFGDPHAKTENRQQIIDNSPKFREYLDHRAEIVSMATDRKLYRVAMTRGKIKIENWDGTDRR